MTKVCKLATAAYLFLILVHLPLEASANTSTAELLISTATGNRLDRSPQWLALLHYTFENKSWKSSISDPKFFLAPDGRSNPQAELESMIRGMTDSGNSEYGNVACRFPARAMWLRENLNFPDYNFHCNVNPFQIERIDPQSAVLVFPAPRTRGAGAMFGHTLIRFDSENRSTLLSYSINYAAHTEKSNFAEIVWNGLSGGFKGRFSFIPYYRKLKEYKEMEERDVWEYPLNLTQQEVRMMALHAIELRDISSEYYFLDENCAQLMLSLIDVARPSLGLANQFRKKIDFWVIPSETIQAGWNASILQPPKYLPSTATKLITISATARKEVLEASEGLYNNSSYSIHGLTSENFDLAVEIAKLVLEYRFSRLEITQETFNEKYSSLVKLGANPKESPVPVPAAPHQGHSAGMTKIGLGYDDKSAFMEFGFRPAYHSKDDPSEGYPKDAELEFLALTGRYYQKQNSFQINKASLINITSLMPYNRFTASTSWKMTIGAERYYLRDGESHLLFNFKTGFGLSSRNETFGTTYFLITGSMIAGGGLTNNINIGPGIETGITKNISNKVQTNSSIKMDFFGINQRETIGNFNFSVSYKAFRDTTISVSSTVSEQEFVRLYPEYVIRLQQYF